MHRSGEVTDVAAVVSQAIHSSLTGAETESPGTGLSGVPTEPFRLGRPGVSYPEKSTHHHSR